MGNLDPIPAGTTATVSMHIDAGDADALMRGNRKYLDAELTVTNGPYKGRKFSGRLTLAH
jgi:hypothetical protein